MKKLSSRDISFLVFVVVFAVFTVRLVMAFQSVGFLPHYTSWEFHECYSNTFDAAGCSNGAYAYYPPLTAVLGRGVDSRVLFFLVLVALFLLVPVAADSFWGGVWFWYVGENWIHTAISGGLLPFSLILLFLTALIAFWGKMPRWVVWFLLAGALLTHNLGGWFFVLSAGALALLGVRRGLASLIVLGIGSLLFSLVFLSDSAGGAYGWRPIFVVLLFTAIFFGKLLHESL